ncbi:MAG: hypothetical protein CL886_06050 [Dehalococcoidia bacterium]|nr:hypothetical protein [Dehalococcoidia bacterium]
MVDIIAVDITPGVSLSELKEYGEQQEYPWLVGRTSRSTLEELGVLTQSTKLGITAGGILSYREAMGVGDVSKWREEFAQLAGTG